MTNSRAGHPTEFVADFLQHRIGMMLDTQAADAPSVALDPGIPFLLQEPADVTEMSREALGFEFELFAQPTS